MSDLKKHRLSRDELEDRAQRYDSKNKRRGASLVVESKIEQGNIVVDPRFFWN